MPELPEVETVVRYLRGHLEGRIVRDLWILPGFSKVIENCVPGQFKKLIIGRRIQSVQRRAKYIVLQLDQGVIGVHLRMTGQLLVAPADGPPPKQLRVRLDLSGKESCYFIDQRKFGRFYFWPSTAELDAALGVEPLSPEFTAKLLWELLRSRSRMIKPLLLDQSVIAGLGNIYTDEVLWQAGIHPQTNCAKIKRAKIVELQKAIRRILLKSIKLNGTTFATFVFGENQSGEFVNQLKVFGKEGRPCPRCRREIVKVKIAQRGTHYCPGCQRR